MTAEKAQICALGAAGRGLSQRISAVTLEKWRCHFSSYLELNQRLSRSAYLLHKQKSRRGRLRDFCICRDLLSVARGCPARKLRWRKYPWRTEGTGTPSSPLDSVWNAPLLCTANPRPAELVRPNELRTLANFSISHFKIKYRKKQAILCGLSDFHKKRTECREEK